MTKSILKEYRYIKKESQDIERRLKVLERQLAELESVGTVIDSVSGGYGGTQHFRIEGLPDGEYSKKKTRLLLQKQRHEINLKRIQEIESDVCSFIDHIPDSRGRTIFRMYYEDGKSQQQIALKMDMDQGTVSRELSKYFD